MKNIIGIVILCVCVTIILVGLGWGLAQIYPSTFMAEKMVEAMSTKQYQDFTNKQSEDAKTFNSELAKQLLGENNKNLNLCGQLIQSQGYVITSKTATPAQ